MKIESVRVQDTNRNAIKEVIVTFDKKTSAFNSIDELIPFLREIKTGIEKQLPRFEDPSGNDWSIYERIEGHEMMDEWCLSFNENDFWEDETYNKADAWELKFEMDVVETFAE